MQPSAQPSRNSTSPTAALSVSEKCPRLTKRRVELARFNLVRFELDDEGVSPLFGLELARLVVDT